jgi:dienelactone hydrolase
MTAITTPIRRIRTRRSRGLAVLGSALIAMTLATGSASATIIERDRFTNHYEFTAWDCGYPMQVVGDESHLIQVRADNRLDGNAFFTDNYQFSETWTAADGRWFTLSGNGVFKDLKAKSLGGSLYQFSFHEVGQPFVIKDSSGKVVSRDRGNVTGSYTFDFADETFNFLGFRLRGPHPMFDVDLCLAVAPLAAPLASVDSARYLTPRPLGSTESAMGFYEYLPPSYTATGAKSPLLLFFHGSGETGDGTPEAVQRLVLAGIPRYINVGGWPTARPFVVLAPQHVEDPPGFDFSSCAGQPFEGSCNMQVQHDLDNAQPAFCTTPDEVHDFIAFAVAHYNVDPARVYVTGLSCGAFGIWEYLAKYHASLQVAAAVPIAGDGRPGSSSDYCALGATPLWAFHGALDDLVDPLGSIEPLTALAACPGVPADEAKLTVYDDRDHNSWDPAYGGADGNDIYAWMLGFSNP